MLRKLTPIVGIVSALFLLATPMGIVAQTVGENTVKSKHIVDGQVKSRDIRDDDVRSRDIKDGEIKSRDVEDYSLTYDDVADELTPAGIAYDNVASSVALTQSDTVAKTITLLAPVRGYIMVSASGNELCFGPGDYQDLVYFIRVIESNSTETSGPPDTDMIPTGEPVRYSAVHAQAVVAGATTVELHARCASPAYSGTFGVDTLSALFVPNRYQ